MVTQANSQKNEFLPLDGRESLGSIFSKLMTKDINDKLNDDLFSIHVKALEYSLSNGLKDTVVSWDGPDNLGLTGKVIIVNVDNNLQCKDFSENITYKESKFDGVGRGCLVDGVWLIKK